MMIHVPIASDHAGFELKEIIVRHMQNIGYTVHDFGTYSVESVDYPDYAHQVAHFIDEHQDVLGILICGSGNGVSITANKHPAVRCALCWNVEIATLARQHNNANIIALPARFISPQEAIALVDAFFSNAFEGGRHQKRIDKIKITTQE